MVACSRRICPYRVAEAVQTGTAEAFSYACRPDTGLHVLAPPMPCPSKPSCTMPESKKQGRGVPFICANVNKCRPAGIRRVGGLNPPLARAQAQHRVLSRALVATKSVGPVTPAQKQEKKTTMQAADNHVKWLRLRAYRRYLRYLRYYVGKEA